MNTVYIVIGLAVIITAIIVINIIGDRRAKKLALQRAKERYDTLLAKYKNEDVVLKIISKTMWQGETKEMVIDSFGSPLDVDVKVMKNNTREVLKYNRLSTTRFGLKITIDNGSVVGWDIK